MRPSPQFPDPGNFSPKIWLKRRVVLVFFSDTFSLLRLISNCYMEMTKSNTHAKSRTQLNDFTFTFHFHALEKEMATHSSVLAWRIPGMGEPGGLPSMGSHRVAHD